MSCDKCNGTGFVRTTDDRGTTRMARCACRKGALPQIVARYEQARVSRLRSAAQRLAKQWPARALYICGPVGTGKTWAAVAIARQEPMLRFLWWPDFISRYRCTDFSDPHVALAELDQLAEVPNLVLDDVGAENETDYGRRVLTRLFEARRDRPLGTIITGNYSVGQLAERYDERLASRVAESCTVILLDGEDRRVAKAS